ncbi:hypothetical protein, partial [Escherichia coli]|uniref:hypothetical protein n=1 Tax=Escherichia coli TaxID=562 RepID=UPI001BFCB533
HELRMNKEKLMMKGESERVAVNIQYRSIKLDGKQRKKQKVLFFFVVGRPPGAAEGVSSATSSVYKRQSKNILPTYSKITF